MFFLKKFLSPLFFPMPMVVLLLAVGVALLWFNRRQRAGRIVVTSGFVVLVVLSYGWLTNPLLRSLEQTYPQPDAAALAQAKWVVVLGGGTFSDPALPLTARATGATLARLVEGIRLQREIPGSRLLLSGAGVFGTGSDAESMAAIAAALGVARADMVLEDESRDTESQAVNVRRIVGSERCIVVTTANHMRRSMALFRKAGLDPIPAPIQYFALRNTGFGPADLYPGLGGLFTAQIVQNEYLGYAWARLRGRI